MKKKMVNEITYLEFDKGIAYSRFGIKVDKLTTLNRGDGWYLIKQIEITKSHESIATIVTPVSSIVDTATNFRKVLTEGKYNYLPAQVHKMYHDDKELHMYFCKDRYGNMGDEYYCYVVLSAISNEIIAASSKYTVTDESIDINHIQASYVMIQMNTEPNTITNTQSSGLLYNIIRRLRTFTDYILS